jgi:hypothetical protein
VQVDRALADAGVLDDLLDGGGCQLPVVRDDGSPGTIRCPAT